MALIYADGRRKGRSSPSPVLPLTRKHADPSTRYRPNSRLRRWLRSRIARLLIYVFVLWNVIEVFLVRRGLANPSGLRPSPAVGVVHEGKPQRIYIASMHWNNAKILRKHWNKAVVELAEALGPQNVFVSVFESGSWDDSKAALKELDHQLEALNVPRNITVSKVTHLDEINKAPEGDGWIDTPRGAKELRRIPYLANLRNRTLRDLLELHKAGVAFDKILFLNDVVFTTDDVLTLLDTNQGHYAAACSLDFSKPPDYYDTFALRDAEGQPHLSPRWPYFKSAVSRDGVVGNWPAVPVTSCWNGIVAMPASPFLAETDPLRFRAIPDSLAEHHLEASECCLIHADNPLSAELGVFLNPRVRVGYNTEAYETTHPQGGGSWVSTWEIFRGLWVSRILRWTYRTEGRDWIVQRRLKKWESETNVEPGSFCLINEMQVLVKNGWAHV